MAIQVSELSEVQFTEQDVSAYFKRNNLGDTILSGFEFVTESRFEAEIQKFEGIENSVESLDVRVTALEAEIDGGFYE